MAGQGRHSEYTPEMGERICELVATTTIGTRTLCRMHDDLPDDTTIYQWRIRHEDFARNYALAKARQAQIMAETIHELCEVETYEDDKGVRRADPGLVAIQRLKVDAVKWEASKLAPKIYGDRSTVETTIKHEENIQDLG